MIQLLAIITVFYEKFRMGNVMMNFIKTKEIF